MDEKFIEETSEKELGLVRDIIRTITKTVKTFNVYPKDNPIYQKFAAELLDKFNAFFKSSDELSLDIEPYALLYKKNKVFQSEDITDNLSMLLFADGLRQLSFLSGITSEEIADFIDILRFAPRSQAADEDDIITLFWEKNIRNVRYSAAEDTMDDDLAVEEALVFEHDELDSADLPDIAASSEYAGFNIPEKPAAEPLNKEELRIIRDELESIDEKFLLSSIAGLFLERLSLEHDSEVFPLFVQNLGKILDTTMQKKDIAGATAMLTDFEKLAPLYDTPRQQELSAAFLSRAGSQDNLRILFRDAPSQEEIRNYLNLLGKTMAHSMLRILGELQDRKQRRLLCEVLAELGRNDIDVFADAVRDERWYLVRNLSMILGMTRHPGAVKYLENILIHPDVRVRREAVRALDNIRTDETKGLFVAVIEDPDEAVRMTALRSLRRFRDPALFQNLKRLASEEELKNKPFEEKKEILETLAALGGTAAFQLLADLFRKRGILEKEETTQMRAAAAYGLGLVATPEARALLEKEAGARKDILREACSRALKGMR